MPEESNLTEKLQEKQSEIKFTTEELNTVQEINHLIHSFVQYN